MIKKNNSYLLDNFFEKEKELERLKQQATAIIDHEKIIWSQAGLTASMNVLDLACGPGIISCELAKFVTSGKVTGFDLSETLLEIARCYQNIERVENVFFRQGDIYQTNFVEQTFDFAYARFIFQHLSEPNKALQNIYQVLKPDGILCIVDIDDAWLTLYPEPASFSSLNQKAARGQQSKGGDRHVGRKLSTYLQTAGFTNVRTSVHVFTTDDIKMKAFLDITVGFKHEMIPLEQREIAIQELKDIYSVLDNPHAWGGVGVFVTTGRRL
ncbi:MAG: methyltransferase domain-containing protein [Nostoc indistinguendum CM1-VF10]|jgi:ubiquinone/menaquinone biosynthesis C-methylase UbiE|nr:methyltransferase domain-containing protein [Nostoc indistinguendum CM1-VF10]